MIQGAKKKVEKKFGFGRMCDTAAAAEGEQTCIYIVGCPTKNPQTSFWALFGQNPQFSESPTPSVFSI